MNKIILILSIVLGLTACDDWVDINSKGTLVDENKLFSDDNAFLNALTDIYTQLRANTIYGEELSLSTLEFLAQNFVPDDDIQRQIADYNYSSAEVQDIFRNIWRDMYRAISSCNKVLEHIENTDIYFYYEGQKEIITGELYALRGALHFELLRMFHPHPSINASFTGMPYMTSYGRNVGNALSTQELLANILNDLNKAAELLYERDPLFSNDRTYGVPVGKIDRRLRTFNLNYYAVTAMLARVHLYQGDYRQAFAYADSTYNHIRTIDASARIFYYYAPGQYGNDRSFSREHIFGIASGPQGLTSVSENMFEIRKIKVRQDFETWYSDVRDTRYRDWFKITDDMADYIMSPKFSRESLLSNYIYTSSSSIATLPVRIPFIKLSEVALIAAEALNEENETNKAAEWIKELQGYRDISFVKDLDTAILTKRILTQEIRAEYHREFYGEGQLFFFHKRMNDAQMIKYDGTSIAMQASNYTFPIPADGLSVTD